MHDGVRGKGSHDLIDGRSICEVCLKEDGLQIHRGTVPHVEIVEHSDLVAGGDEGVDSETSDIAGAAGDKDFHKTHKCLLLRR